MRRKTIRRCGNEKCRVTIPANRRYCLSCRYLARRMFARGVFVAGIIGGIIKLILVIAGK